MSVERGYSKGEYSIEKKATQQQPEVLRWYPKEIKILSPSFRSVWNINRSHTDLDSLSPDTVPITHELAEELLEKDIRIIANHLEEYLPHCLKLASRLADGLIDNGFTELLSLHFVWFIKHHPDLNQLAEKMMSANCFCLVADRLEMFPAGTVDIRALKGKLIKGEKWFEVLRNIDKLQIESVEMKEMLARLVRGGYGYVVASFLEKIPVGLVDIEELVDKLVDTERTRDIFQNIDAFIKHSVDVEHLINKILESKDAFVLAYDFEKLPKELIDAQSLVSRLLEKRCLSAVVFNLEKFPEGSVDYDVLLDDLVSKTNGNEILNRIDLFIRYVGARRLVRKLMGARLYPVVAYGLDKFPKDLINIRDLIAGLISLQRLDCIFRNLDKFPIGSIEEINDLVNASSQSRYVGMLFDGLRGLAKHNVDMKALADVFLNRGLIEAVANNFEKFPEGSVDAKRLVDKLIDEHRWKILKWNLHKFPVGSVDVRKMLDEMEEHGVSSIEYFDGLVRHSTDIKYLVQKMIDFGRADWLVERLEKLPEGSVDVKNLARSLIRSGNAKSILENYEKFPTNSIDDKKLIDALIKTDKTQIVNNLEKFPEESIGSEIRKELLINISDALVQHRYRHVKMWLENKSEECGADSIRGMFNEIAANKEMEALIRDKRFKNAKYLKDCLEMTGARIAPALSNALETGTPYRETLPRSLDTMQHNVMDEVLEFYAGAFFERKILSIISVEDWSHKLDFKDRMEIEEVKGSYLKHRQKLKQWVKQYMIEAVASELRNQPQYGLRAQTLQADEFFQRSAREDILDYFDSASARFLLDEWQTQYGGQSWSRVAQAGYTIWANDIGFEQIMDYIFDLQHNTGAIFDKRWGQITQDNEKLKQVLEFKREGSLIGNLPKLDGVCDQELISSIHARMRILDRICGKLGISEEEARAGLT